MKYVLLFLSFFFTIPAFSQSNYTISGQVTDTKGNPISQALIVDSKKNKGTYTNDKGYYQIDLQVGKNTLTATCFGYKDASITLQVSRNEVVNFQLKEQPLLLQDVQVYGKSKSQQTREGVFAVNALDVKPIISNLNNLNTLVGRSSGIKVREDGGVGANFDLTINGLSGNAIRYFIDGVPLSSMGSGINLSNLPINIVDRIEVYKGSVPVELGSDALGGAINIITKNDIQDYLDVSYGIGSFDTHKADLSGQYTLAKTGIIIKPTLGLNFSKNNYKMKNVEVWNKEEQEFQEIDTKRFHDKYFSAFGKVEVGVTRKRWADSFFISASASSINKQLQTGSVQTFVYGKAKRENEAYTLAAHYKKQNFIVRKLAADLTLSHSWDKSMVVDTAYRKYSWDGSYQESSRNEILGRGKSIRHIKRPKTHLRSNFNYKLNPSHNLNLNYLLNRTSNDRYDELDEEFEPSKDKLTKHIIGLSYQQNFWKEKLSNTFFAKNYINHLSIGQTDLSWITGSKDVPQSSTTNNWGYGLASRLNIFQALAIKASYEHSVRLPLSREYLGNGTTIYPNFSLKPENSNNINFGLFGSIGSPNAHQLTYEGNYFIRDVKDYIRLVVTDAEGTSQYSNVKNVKINGVEGELRYDYADIIQVVLNGTYVDEKNTSKYMLNGKPDITYKNRIPNHPWLYSNFECSYKLKNLFGNADNHLKLAYYFQYVHWFYLTWEGYGSLESKSTIPTQCTSDLQLSYSFHQNRYNVSLECNNIFDKLVYDNFMLQKPGRSFFCKFRLFIN